MTNPDVLIVGAGPVGLFTALRLSRKGVSVKVVDTGVWPCQHSYALALHPQSVGLFRETGLSKQILIDAYPVHSVGLFDRDGKKAQIELGRGDSAMQVLRQDHMEALLESALEEQGVSVDWRHEVLSLEEQGNHVKAVVGKLEKESRGYIVAHTEWVVAKKSEIEARFVIGADGYNSRVRRALNVDYPEVGEAQYFAVFEFASDADLNNQMAVVFGEGGSAALWPLPGGRCRWSFELPGFHDPDVEAVKDRLLASGFGYFPTERAKDRELTGETAASAMTAEQQLRAYLKERAPWFRGSIDEVVWHTIVRFERRLASRFGKGRMWLAGDSAHLTGPVAIQSMNVGLFEGADLAGVVTSNASSADLEAYGERWQAEWKRLHGLAGGLQATPETDPWVAERLKALLSCLPAHGPALANLGSQLKLAS